MTDRQTDRQTERQTQRQRYRGKQRKREKDRRKEKRERVADRARVGENTQKEGKGRSENDLPHRPQNFRQLMRAQDLY